LILILILALPFFSFGSEKEEISLEIIVFESSSCEHCQQLKKEYFNRLLKEYGFLHITYYDLKYPENYQLLLDIQSEVSPEKSSQVINELPLVVVGEEILAGEAEIKARLDQVIGRSINRQNSNIYSQSRSVEKGTSPGKVINLAYFYEPGCRECRAVEYALSYLKSKYPYLEVEYFNLAEGKNRLIQEALGEICNLPLEKRHLTPAIYVGREYVIKDIDIKYLEEVIEGYRDTGSEKIWLEAEKNILRIEERAAVQGYLEKLKVPAVVAAGLIDGVNPCAFSIVIFLITYLGYLNRGKEEIFQMGVLFIMAVFVSYFLIGIGLLEFLRRASFFPSIRRIIFLVGVAFTALLGALSLGDYFRIKRSNPESMLLKVPSRWRRAINTFIGRKVRERRFLIPLSLGIGFLASSVEFICTGQIYLPTLIFLSGISRMRRAVVLPLLLYNFSFVIPLIGVFLAVYLGVSSGIIARITMQNSSLSKVLTSVLFFSLSGILFFLM